MWLDRSALSFAPRYRLLPPHIHCFHEQWNGDNERTQFLRGQHNLAQMLRLRERSTSWADTMTLFSSAAPQFRRREAKSPKWWFSSNMEKSKGKWLAAWSIHKCKHDLHFLWHSCHLKWFQARVACLTAPGQFRVVSYFNSAVVREERGRGGSKA